MRIAMIIRITPPATSSETLGQVHHPQKPSPRNMKASSPKGNATSRSATRVRRSVGTARTSTG